MNSKLWHLPLALLAMMSVVCLGDPQPAAQQVSLIQLIGNPEKFNGKEVEIVGYLSLDSEGDALFLAEGDYLNAIVSNSIWLNKVRSTPGYNDSHDHKYVKIVGKFQSGEHGRLTGRAGGITDIKLFAKWSDPRNPIMQRLGKAIK